MMTLMCVIQFEKIQMNFFTKEKQICRYQKQTYDYQKGNRGEG